MKYEDLVILIVSALLLAAVLFGVSGCAVHRESAASLDSKSASNEEVSVRVDTEIHKVEGPGRVTTTVEEFVGSDARGDSPGPADAGLARAPDPTNHLVKRTVSVAEFGPITTDTHAKADSSAAGARTAILDGRMEQVKDSKPSLGIPALGLVLAGLAAAAVFTRSIWLGPLVTLAKRLLGRG